MYDKENNSKKKGFSLQSFGVCKKLFDPINRLMLKIQEYASLKNNIRNNLKRSNIEIENNK